jgi:hypothetical protein
MIARSSRNSKNSTSFWGLAEDRRPDLIKAVNLVYDKDHAVVATLTHEDVAFVRMAAIHESDLPLDVMFVTVP